MEVSKLGVAFNDHTTVEHTDARIEIPVDIRLHEGNPGICSTDTINADIKCLPNSIFASELLA
jgi:hypothetical protein